MKELYTEGVGAENPVRPAQTTIRYSWIMPPRRSALRSLAASTSPMVAGVASESAGGRWLRDRWGRWQAVAKSILGVHSHAFG